MDENQLQKIDTSTCYQGKFKSEKQFIGFDGRKQRTISTWGFCLMKSQAGDAQELRKNKLVIKFLDIIKLVKIFLQD